MHDRILINIARELLLTNLLGLPTAIPKLLIAKHQLRIQPKLLPELILLLLNLLWIGPIKTITMTVEGCYGLDVEEVGGHLEHLFYTEEFVDGLGGG
jgi:hypothetical protein